jgi:hypothetical protein
MLLVFIILGFIITMCVVFHSDCRVFDLRGKYVGKLCLAYIDDRQSTSSLFYNIKMICSMFLAGPISNLWGKNLNSVLWRASQERQVSNMICDELLFELGRCLI